MSGGLDDLRFQDFRFLEEAAKLGNQLRVLLWPDEAIELANGKAPKFPQIEREYFLSSVRWIDEVVPAEHAIRGDELPIDGAQPDVWAVRESDDTAAKRSWCKTNHIEYRLLRDELLGTTVRSPRTPENPQSERKKVVVTGCYDWFHSGHVRFFEECSELGDLYVMVGNDENVRELKGEGHPFFPALQRRYIVGAIRYVTLALISSGRGWMDAEPEILKIRPDIYAVNEDGDKPEKAEFCRQRGIEYRVLKRLPKEGLPTRQSTALRGF
ncbi:MAG TPA: adenylyltransferase/cytidyltransferase family protein [Tepidisphaeraceae bacterium]